MSPNPTADSTPIRRVVLLEPSPPDTHIFSRFKLPRLGVVLLGTILRDLGYDVKVMVEDVLPFDFDTIVGADVVGISSITPTAGRAFALADQLRARGITVVMGGPHPTHLADECLDHADYVVRGEGELALPALLRAIADGTPLEAVPNLSHRSDGEVQHNPIATLEPDLDRWPDPDLTLVEGFGARSFTGLRRVVPIQTSRGCPHDCSFCSVTTTFGRRMRYRAVDRVIGEMKRHDVRKTIYFFYDDNFAASPRRVRELLAGFRTLPHKPRWSAQVRADVARDDKLLDEMAEAGCHTVFIGLESVNQETLAHADKRQDLTQVAEHLRRIRARKIRIHGMFVLGFDTDSYDTLDRTVEFARKYDLMSVQFLILTPLPGSRTHREMTADGRILARDWSLYDTHHVCIRPTQVTPLELQRWQTDGHDRFYTVGQAVKRILQGRIAEGLLTLYARRINKQWLRDNRDYLRRLEEVSAPSADLTAIHYQREFPALAAQVERAVARAS